MGRSVHLPSPGWEDYRLWRRPAPRPLAAPVPAGAAESPAAAVPASAPPGCAGDRAPALVRSRWTTCVWAGLSMDGKDSRECENRDRGLTLLYGDRDVQHLVRGDEPGHVMAHGGEGQDAGGRAVGQRTTNKGRLHR